MKGYQDRRIIGIIKGLENLSKLEAFSQEINKLGKKASYITATFSSLFLLTPKYSKKTKFFKPLKTAN